MASPATTRFVSVAAIALAVGGVVTAGAGRVHAPAASGSPGPRALSLHQSAPGHLVPAAGQRPVASHEQTPEPRALLDTYCVACHNARVKTAGLILDSANVARVGDDAETWEKVAHKLRGGMMPPLGRPRPDQSAIDGFVTYLETSLDREALAKPHPGRSPLHRLNRSEYANAVRDLLALEIDVASLLPADDESSGFDNMADVLKVSPSLLEQYLTAARKISSLAVGDPATPPISQVYRVPPTLSQERHIEGLPLGTRGGILIHHTFPLDATYRFNVFLLRNIVGYMTGLEFPHLVEITIDGMRVFEAQVGGEDDNLASDQNMSATGDRIDERLKTSVRVTAGPHAVGVAFVRRNSSESDEPLQPFTRNLDLQDMNGVPLVDYVQITGPFDSTGPGDTPSRRRIFTCSPSTSLGASAGDEATPAPAKAWARPRRSPPAVDTSEGGCARQILSTLARRAYRGMETGRDIDTLLEFYRQGRRSGTFERGIESALRLMLVSPKFLFRAEPDPAGVAPGSLYPVRDLELASRLSFFLWSSIPDDELLDLAARGTLHEPAVLDAQVQRMLADRRAGTLVTNFAAQWLFLRNLEGVTLDSASFPNFDENLRQAFRRETELFVESIIREDRSVLDLLNADYTFVDGQLARHYGIPGVYGSRFRRVTLTDENRRGLLGHGSILTVTSYPNRTSPVLRGKWVLQNIFGTPPPAPPPNVPALKESGEGGQAQSVRERLEAHRQNPACANCHRVMDPLGFSLENFDAVGRWRTEEEGGPVDARGELADGTPADGPAGLRRAIMRDPDQFVRTVAEKLLTYALGRGLEYYDMPVVRQIARDAEADDYRFSSLVRGIVSSTPFRMKKADGSKTE